MKPLAQPRAPVIAGAIARRVAKQSGVVLFIALIALVVMSLAAVALVRSVDTSTVIAGNLAFRQAATNSADGGFESAIQWLDTTAKANTAKDPAKDTDHPFNITKATDGYYSYVNSALDLTAEATWSSGTSKEVGEDATGNTVRYIVQRMCRTENSITSTTNCLYGNSTGDNGEKLAGELSLSSGAASVMYRVTARVTGPKNTVSYIQAFVY